jgi:hypothetical protein
VPLRGHYSFAILSQYFPPQTFTRCNTHLLSTRPSLQSPLFCALITTLPFSALLPFYVNHYDPPAQHQAQFADL